jgi:hypothetical protein
MFVIAILAPCLLVFTQQMTIRRQQTEIRQLRQSIDATVKNQEKLTTIIREQDHIEGHR